MEEAKDLHKNDGGFMDQCRCSHNAAPRPRRNRSDPWAILGDRSACARLRGAAFSIHAGFAALLCSARSGGGAAVAKFRQKTWRIGRKTPGAGLTAGGFALNAGSFGRKAGGALRTAGGFGAADGSAGVNAGGWRPNADGFEAAASGFRATEGSFPASAWRKNPTNG